MPQGNPTKHKPLAGQRFGELVIIQRVADKNTPSANLRVQVRVECSCGQRLTIPYYYLIRRQPLPKTHCDGPAHKTLSALYPDMYVIWLMMHKRCEDPQHVAYKHYGGRGIIICPEWHAPTTKAGYELSLDNKGFERFLNYMGPRPSKKYSIDRVDNDGNYQPYQPDGKTRQVRWATAKQQRANQRPRS